MHRSLVLEEIVQNRVIEALAGAQRSMPVLTERLGRPPLDTIKANIRFDEYSNMI